MQAQRCERGGDDGIDLVARARSSDLLTSPFRPSDVTVSPPLVRAVGCVGSSSALRCCCCWRRCAGVEADRGVHDSSQAEAGQGVAQVRRHHQRPHARDRLGRRQGQRHTTRATHTLALTHAHEPIAPADELCELTSLSLSLSLVLSCSLARRVCLVRDGPLPRSFRTSP